MRQHNVASLYTGIPKAFGVFFRDELESRVVVDFIAMQVLAGDHGNSFEDKRFHFDG